MRRWLAAPLLTLILGSALQAGPAPDFTGKTLDGKVFRLKDVLGKRVIVVDFWATWCAPCVKMLKKLQALQESHPEVLVLSVTIDDATSQAKVSQLIQGKGYTFPVILDPDSAILRLFHPPLDIPYCLVIDRQGNVAYTHAGYVPGDEKALADRLDSLK